GRLTWWLESGQGANPGAELYVRAGNTSNPENNWSAWQGPYRDAQGAEVESPASRFVQWKVVLQGGKGSAPELSWVNLAYLPKTVAPEIDAIAIQDPGVRVGGGGGGQNQAASVQLRLPAASPFPGAASAAPRAAQNESPR